MRCDDCLVALRKDVVLADYCLTDVVYDAVCRLARDCNADWLRKKTPEFARSEFLLNVSASGEMVGVADELIGDFRTRTDLSGWFCEAEGTLAVARWLAHLVGLRHRVIQLFLDLPGQTDVTCVQVRSFEKYNSPGCFDMPVGGHVKVGTSVQQSLVDEVAEELGLVLDRDVAGIHMLGTYSVDDVCRESLPDYFDVEHTTVFKGQLVSGAWERLRFVDGEVAALAVFRVSELATLLRDFPERVGGGLRDSFPFYAKG